MHLPSLASTLLVTRAQDPLAQQPDYSKDRFPPYPPMTNADGSNITLENLRGTRLYGWKGCEVQDTKAISDAFDDFYKLANPISSNIDWAGEIAEDFWGRDKGQNRVPDDRRRQIQQIFAAQQQMYAIGWHLLPPYWTSLCIEVRCSGNDGSGDPDNFCRDRKPNDGKCGRGGTPDGGNTDDDNTAEAYAESPTRDKELTYSRITFCNRFFNLPSLSEVMNRTPKKPLQLDSWDNRARVFLHETTHLDYFMNTPGWSPNVIDLKFLWRENRVNVRDYAYGPKFTKILRNYGLQGMVGFWPQRNADSFAWFALGSYIKQKTGTYPRYPRPRNVPPAPAPPAGAKTNALSVVFQKTLDEVGNGYDWLFFPGKQGESMVCHNQKDSWHFTSKVGPNKDGTPPWPAGAFHFDNLFGRACDYKDDGNDNAGMLWCKEENGLKDIGIQCESDQMRTAKTTKQCTKSGLIPLIEHIAVVHCEW